MSLVMRNLSILSYANGFTLWHYKSHLDTIKEVQEPEYFVDAGDTLREGDMIMVTAVNGSAILAISSSNNSTMKVS
jgi:hypothetical protein